MWRGPVEEEDGSRGMEDCLEVMSGGEKDQRDKVARGGAGEEGEVEEVDLGRGEEGDLWSGEEGGPRGEAEKTEQLEMATTTTAMTTAT